MSEKFGAYVDEHEEIEHFRENQECVCGNDLSDDVLMGGRFSDFSYKWCDKCDRRYLKAIDDDYVTAEYILSCEQTDGVHKLDFDEPAPFVISAVYSLMDMLFKVQEHMDLRPRNYDGIWYYVEESIVLGFLVEEKAAVDSIGVAKGYRHQGIGTKLVTQFKEKKKLETVEITGSFDEVKDFWRKLPFEVEIRVNHDEL